MRQRYSKKIYSSSWNRKDAFHNPFIPGRRGRVKPASADRRGVAVLIALFLVISGWIYFIFGSPYFRIGRIEARGDADMKRAIEQAIGLIAGERKLGLITQNNLFLFPKERAANRLKEQLLLQTLSVEKQYPNAIIVNFETKTPSLIYTNKKFTYTLDLMGSVIKKEEGFAPTSTDFYEAKKAQGLPILNGHGEENVGISGSLLDENLVQFIKKIFKNLPESAGIEAKNFSLDPESPSTLIVHTQKNFNILLNIRTDALEQINKLTLILKEKGPAESAALQYIDLRFGDRVFLK